MASSGSVIVLDEGEEEEEEEEEEGGGRRGGRSGDPPPPARANGTPPAALSGKDPESLRAENQRLFQEFVALCSQHTTEHPEVMPYLASRHQKTDPQFLASVEFRNVLGRCLTLVQAKRSKVYVYINELCTVFKAHSQKRKLVPTSSAATATATATATTEASPVPTGPSEPQAEPPRPRGGSKRQIRYLENLLQAYAVEIRRLQERELDLEELDQEDSAYLQESRLKRRMMRIFERLCELKDCNSLTGRVIEQRIHYRGTRYPEINRRVEHLINRPEAFPDYNDILKVVQKANSRHSLQLPKRQMEGMAADAFRDVGSRLQERRHLDLVYNFGSHLTDQYRPGSDPALADGELARRLRHNREWGLQRLEQVVSRYAQLQDQGEEEEWRRKRGLPPSSSTTSHQQGELASPREGSLSPRVARKGALRADEEEEDDEEEEEEESSLESDIEAEMEKSLEEDGEDDEGPAPEDEEPPAQEVEADQRLDPEGPEVILYSSTEEELEEEEEEEEDEEAGGGGEAGRTDKGQQGEEPPAGLFVPQVTEETLPLEGSETPPPSPLPWAQEGSFPPPLPLLKEPPPIKRSRALENGSLCPADQTSIPGEAPRQPPRKRARREHRLSKSPLSSSCIEVLSAGSSEEEGEGGCSPPPLHSPAPVADSTWADSPGVAVVTSSQGSPAPICKTSVATQCDPEEIIILSDSD